MKDEALKLGLEALQEPLGFTGSREIDAKLREAITAIKQALAAPVQPMAHIVGEIDHTGKVWKPVQPAPVQPLTWLKTIETPGGFGKFVEAKPNEKGAKPVYLTPPAAPVQPVSGVVLRDGYPTLIQDKHIKETDQRLCILPTTPPAAQRQWVGLTDDEVHETAIKCVRLGQSVNAAIRAIEAKLKEKNT